MKLSVRGRISIGFGLVLAIMVFAAISNWVLVKEMERHIGDYRTAVAQRSNGYELDLRVAAIRLRVNQWLRSMSPDFEKQADALLEQLVPMARQIAAESGPGETQDNIQKLLGSTAAYMAGWRELKGLATDEANIYDQDLVTIGNRIRTNLARARQAEASRNALPAALLLADAQQSLTEAEKFALLDRASPNPDLVAHAAAAISALRDCVQKCAAATQDPATGLALTAIAADVGEWEKVFSRVKTIAQTRAERLVSLSRDLGEPMGNAADAIKDGGKARAGVVEAEQFAAIASGRATLYVITTAGLLIGGFLSWGGGGGCCRGRSPDP